MTLREPPSNLAAEEHVLSAMLTSPKATETVLELLEPEGERAFYRDTHRHIYQTLRDLHLEDVAADPLLVADRMRQAGTLDEERLGVVAATEASVGNVAHHALLVRDAWARRGLLRVVRDSEQALTDQTAAEAADRLERGLLNVRATVERGQGSTASYQELADQLVERVADPPARGAGLPTPFSFLPNLLPGRVHILAGETAHGKTAAGMQFAGAVARRGLRVGLASIEMTKEQMYDRQIAMFGVPLAEVTSGRVSPQFRDPYLEAVLETRAWRIEVNDDPEFNALALRRWQRIRRYDLLIVDHLHQIVLGGKPGDRRHMLEDEVQGFVTLAKAENVPVLLLAQLSRGRERPTLDRLRESGKIEQQAAMVWFCWRQGDDKGQLGEEAEWIVAKDRFGPTFSRPMRFDAQRVRYLEVSEEEAAWR